MLRCYLKTIPRERARQKQTAKKNHGEAKLRERPCGERGGRRTSAHATPRCRSSPWRASRPSRSRPAPATPRAAGTESCAHKRCASSTRSRPSTGLDSWGKRPPCEELLRARTRDSLPSATTAASQTAAQSPRARWLPPLLRAPVSRYDAAKPHDPEVLVRRNRSTIECTIDEDMAIENHVPQTTKNKCVTLLLQHPCPLCFGRLSNGMKPS